MKITGTRGALRYIERGTRRPAARLVQPRYRTGCNDTAVRRGTYRGNGWYVIQAPLGTSKPNEKLALAASAKASRSSLDVAFLAFSASCASRAAVRRASPDARAAATNASAKPPRLSRVVPETRFSHLVSRKANTLRALCRETKFCVTAMHSVTLSAMCHHPEGTKRTSPGSQTHSRGRDAASASRAKS